MTKDNTNTTAKNIGLGFIIGILVLMLFYLSVERPDPINEFCIEKGYNFGELLGTKHIQCSVYLKENFDKQSMENPVILHKTFEIGGI